MTIRVINALVRLVHGGRGMEDSKQFKDQQEVQRLIFRTVEVEKAAYMEKEYQDNSISNGMWSR